jgi:hypothetical protein
MKRILNTKITTLVKNSMNTLKTTLSNPELKIVKSEFTDIYNGQISTGNSFSKINYRSYNSLLKVLCHA